MRRGSTNINKHTMQEYLSLPISNVGTWRENKFSSCLCFFMLPGIDEFLSWVSFSSKDFGIRVEKSNLWNYSPLSSHSDLEKEKQCKSSFSHKVLSLHMHYGHRYYHSANRNNLDFCTVSKILVHWTYSFILFSSVCLNHPQRSNLDLVTYFHALTPDTNILF